MDLGCDACGGRGKFQNEEASRGMGWSVLSWAEHAFDICDGCSKEILKSSGIAKRAGIAFVDPAKAEK